MMPGKVVAAGRGHGMQLVVRKAAAEMTPGGRQRVHELIIGIIHPVHPEHFAQAPLVESGIVSNQRQPFDQRLDLLPHTGKYGRVFGILRPQPVHLAAEPLVVFRFRVDEAVEAVGDLSVPHDHHAHRAHAATAFVGGFKVYGGEVGHFRFDMMQI